MIPLPKLTVDSMIMFAGFTIGISLASPLFGSAADRLEQAISSKSNGV